MTIEVIGEQKNRWKSGVIPYAQMGYWKPDYEPKDHRHFVCISYCASRGR